LSFGARIIAVDVALSGTIDGVPVSNLEACLPVADIITLHSSGDREILGEAEFAQLKSGAYVLNCGRGGQINESALCRALDRGQVAGAWLDVFAEEPYRGPLTQYPQVLLSPHLGSYTAECRSRMEMESVENLLNGFGL
jgi:D-3-phosphoglycerate dehydrogenase